MSTIEKSIDVHVPVQVAYNQWTQFEEFPRFMEGVEEVRQIDATRRASPVGWRRYRLMGHGAQTTKREAAPCKTSRNVSSAR